MNKIQFKYRSVLIFEIVLTLFVVFNAFSTARGATKVALWQGDKKGAVSITFQDGLPSQFNNAFPILQQRGLKATFNIISSQADAASIQKVVADGQEIGSQTVTGQNLTMLSTTQQITELSQSQLTLQQLTGQKVSTIAYPNGGYNTSVMNLARNYYIAGRSADSMALNGSLPDANQFYKLVVIGPHDTGSGDAIAITYLQSSADKAASEGKWDVELFHSIGVTGGFDMVSTQAFGTHMDYLVASEPNLWVAPMGTVSEYIYERNAASITTVASDSNMIQLNLHCGLDSRFNTPLTLLTDCPAGWTTSDIHVRQGQTEQSFSLVSKNGKLCIKYNAVPDAGTIELSVNQVTPVYYTIASSADVNGTIDPNGTITKLQNSNQLFTTIPNSGYQVDKWFVNGVAVQTSGNTYNLTSIQTNSTVYVTFKQFSITVETTVAQWHGDKKGVVSLSFDDELNTQFLYAFPILQQHGLKATFYIVTSEDADPTTIRTIAADGQEIGSHSVTHPDLTTLSAAQQINELSQSQAYLQQASGQKVDTFAYPYGAYNTNVINLVKNYYISARSAELNQLNSSSPTSNEFYTLFTVVPYQNGSDDASVIAYLRSQADKAISTGNWAIETYHGVNKIGYEPVSTLALTTHLDYLVANQNNLWVAPVGTVSEYIYEGDAALITMLTQDSNVIRLNLHCGLDSRFTTPLTLLTDCPPGWNSQDIHVKQGQTSQIAAVISKNGSLYIMYDTVPDAGTIELSVGQISLPTNYTIIVSAGLHGTITPSGAIQEIPDSSQLFTAAPDAGYAVDKWSLDGSNIQTGGTTFTLNNIQANHTVSVIFGMLPSAPASITYPTTSSTGQYTVSWPSSTGGTSYQLERSNDNGSTWSQIYSGANASYSENIGNGSYRYHVKATNALGSSNWTTGTGNCVVGIPPQPPISISYPASSSTGQYTVQWSSSSGATSYQLARSSDGGTIWTQIYSGSNTSRSEKLSNGSYHYRVRAINASGSSAWTTGTFDCVVVIPPPPPPISISYPASSNTGQYTVQWFASSGATSYQLQQSTDAGITWAQIYSGSNTSRSQSVSNGSYRYRVTATNTGGSSDWTTGALDCVVLKPPTAPAGVSASDSTFAGKVQVSWNVSNTATSYEIWRNTRSKTGSATKIAEVTSLTYDDTSVTAGTTYWYWVKAKNSGGTSGFSSGDSGNSL